VYPTEIVDLSRLILPISESCPTGIDPRTDPTALALYRGIRASRSAVRMAERSISTMEHRSDVGRPDWKPVMDRAIQILTEHSKDLEIVSYLIESLVRLHGFAGLHEGFRLCHLLVQTYWDDIHPRPDEDGLATRIAPLMGLNGEAIDGTLITPILNIPLTNSPSVGDFGCAHHDQAIALERIADPKIKARRIDEAGVSLKTFREAASDTPNMFYAFLDRQIRGCAEEFQRLTDLLDRHCGNEAPHSSNIKNAILHCHEVVLSVAGDRIKTTIPASGNELDGFLEVGNAELADSFGNSEIACSDMPGYAPEIFSREQALSVLEFIAAYFRQNEPHSPIPSALEQAVRWGRTPLADLLAELIPDDNARQHYCRMVGLSTRPGLK
jgi:type VI secretion system protein ImpA